MSTTSINFQFLVNIQKYIIYFNYIIIIAGLIGNSLNIFVFTKLKIFRNNRCTFYLIIESIMNIIMLLEYSILQIFQLIYGIDPSNLSIIWCKIRTTLSQPCRLLISSIICFEALDQYLSTHYRFYLRQFSTFELARYLISIVSFLWFLQSIPYIIFYDIIPNSGCVIISKGLIYYYSYFYYIFLNGLIPIIISCLFSLLAYRNVRYFIRLRIAVHRKRLDRQMTAMIFVRVIAFVILLTPYTIHRIYIFNNKIPSLDILNLTMTQLISTIVLCLLLWIYSLNFYIFLFTSSRYRRQVKYLIKKYWQTIKRNRNDIHPLSGTSSESGAEFH